MSKQKKEDSADVAAPGRAAKDGAVPNKAALDKAVQASPESGGAAPEKAGGKPGKAKKAAEASETGGRKKRGRSMRGRSKRHEKLLQEVDCKRRYPLDEAVKVLKKITTGTKFNQSINVVMHLGIDPKNADQMIRGSVSLPKGIGSTKKVIAFCDGNEADEAKAAGAIEVGVDDLIKKISDGWTDFDVAIAHPRTMAKVGKLGRVLGPAGKMPSPKNGTVTNDIATAVKEFAAGKIEFRNDPGGNIHAIVGKANFPEADLKENIDAFIGHIRRMKPPSSKGTFIKKACVLGTMSPAIELEVAQ
jgi:large subunit ribosomal protein L1